MCSETPKVLLAAGGERGVIRILDIHRKSQYTAVRSFSLPKIMFHVPLHSLYKRVQSIISLVLKANLDYCSLLVKVREKKRSIVSYDIRAMVIMLDCTVTLWDVISSVCLAVFHGPNGHTDQVLCVVR